MMQQIITNKRLVTNFFDDENSLRRCKLHTRFVNFSRKIKFEVEEQ